MKWWRTVKWERRNKKSAKISLPHSVPLIFTLVLCFFFLSIFVFLPNFLFLAIANFFFYPQPPKNLSLVGNPPSSFSVSPILQASTYSPPTLCYHHGKSCPCHPSMQLASSIKRSPTLPKMLPTLTGWWEKKPLVLRGSTNCY